MKSSLTGVTATTPRVIALLISLSFSQTVQAAEAAFADGKVWIMSGSDGHSGKVIFDANGTGKISSGFISMGLTWHQKASVTCIKMGPMAEQCFMLTSTAGGFDGIEQGGKRKMTLRRN
jgi:hypothetical protein